jgi:hypothetical protein
MKAYSYYFSSSTPEPDRLWFKLLGYFRSYYTVYTILLGLIPIDFKSLYFNYSYQGVGGWVPLMDA